MMTLIYSDQNKESAVMVVLFEAAWKKCMMEGSACRVPHRRIVVGTSFEGKIGEDRPVSTQRPAPDGKRWKGRIAIRKGDGLQRGA